MGVMLFVPSLSLDRWTITQVKTFSSQSTSAYRTLGAVLALMRYINIHVLLTYLLTYILTYLPMLL